MAGAKLGAPQTYSVPWYARLLHDLPHYNLSLQKTSSTFDFRSSSYAESLLVVALAAVLWLALWLLIFAVYSCYVCITCRKEAEKTTRTRPFRWLTVVLVICTGGLTALALYANEKTSAAVWRADTSLHRVRAAAERNTIEMSATYSELKNLTWLVGALSSLRSHDNDTAASVVVALSSLLIDDSGSNVAPESVLSVPFASRLFNLTLQEVKEFDHYRWIVTLSTCLWLLTFCLLLWAAIGCKSRCATFVCVALACLSQVAVWVIAGAYLAVNVAVADACVDPRAALSVSINASESETGFFDYYTTCAGTDPMAQEFHALRRKLTDVHVSMRMLHSRLPKGSPASTDVTAAAELVTNVTDRLFRQYSLTDCRHYSRDFTLALVSLCHDGLSSLVYAVLAFAAAGNLIIAITFLALSVARHTGSKKAQAEVEAHDMAAARNHHAGVLTENPLYYRFSQISSSDTDPNGSSGASQHPKPSAAMASRVTASGPTAPLLRRPSPPPTIVQSIFDEYHDRGQPHHYHSGDFYSSYSSNQGTMENRRRGSGSGA